MGHFIQGLFLLTFVHLILANPIKLSENGDQDFEIDLEHLKNGPYMQSCDEAISSGVYELRLPSKSLPFRAFCDVESLYGKWLVFQQRVGGSLDFNRSRIEYIEGFGQIGESTEYWLGLELIHQITASGDFELAIEMKNEAGKYGFARYDEFGIAGESQRYKLIRLGRYRGSIADNISYFYRFAVEVPGSYDPSNEIIPYGFLNAPFMTNPQTGERIKWDEWTRAKTFSRMMIRRKLSP